MGRPALRLLFAVVAGLLHAASMATPWDRQPAGWLQLLALAWFAVLLQSCIGRPRQAAGLGWAFATAWLAGTFWWMFVAMHTYAGLAAVLAVLAVLGLSAALALYYAAASAAYAAWAPATGLRGGLLFAALWLLAELARGVWFTGFGWGGAAYAHIDGLAHAAKYIGAYGVAAVVAGLAWMLAASVRMHAWRARLGCWAAVAAVAGLMAWSPGRFTTALPVLQVALLQGNIAQDEKFEPGTGVGDSLRWYGEQLSRNTASLVVAPETALPLLPQQLPAGYWTALLERFNGGDQAALIGIPLGDMEQGYTNSVLGLRAGQPPGSALYRYDKHHLVPFGEFIPPLFRWFTEMMNIPLGDFARGGLGQPSFDWQGQRLAPNVCYEDLFGEELAVRFRDPARAPTVFVNLSNIAWFGNTVAIDQHVAISRLRALEFERPFIRATNTGDTAVIDHTGRVVQALPRYTRDVLRAEVQGREGTTPFAWWAARAGLWPLWLLALVVVAGCAWASARGRRLLA